MSDRRPHLVVVDDEPDVLSWLSEVLRRHYVVEATADPRIALERVTSTDVDLLISDIEMPHLRGTELLAAVQRQKPSQLVLMMTAFGSIELAVQTVRAGATDFIAKPFTEKALVTTVERALAQRMKRPDSPGALIARSEAMKRVVAVATRAARSDAAILLTGESGVGKGTIARYIHDKSARHLRPFLEVKCLALPGGLIEPELFGARGGVFVEARDGAFVDASGGTLVLDEVSEMTFEAQSKLRLALETSKVRPIGLATEVPVDARVIATTSRPLQPLIDGGVFRRDLFYCLNIIPIEIPPLRERPEDIPDLVRMFIARSGRQVSVAEPAMEWLASQSWPGNVRQLATVIERAVALSERDTVQVEDLHMPDQAPVDDVVERGLFVAAERQVSLDQLERAYIRQVIGAVAGNMSEAARILRIDRRTLYRKVGDQT